MNEVSLTKKEFLADEIELKRIYSDFDSDYKLSPLNFAKIEKIYGALKFPNLKADRPFLYASFVTAIDGTIAFKDNLSSSQIVRNKEFDSKAGKADLWILNLLRTVADGIILGPKTLQVESSLTAHIFDKELIEARTKLLNKTQIPYNIIISKKGKTIPYEHRIFSEEEIPVMIVTSPQGAQFITEQLNYPVEVIDLTAANMAEGANELNNKEEIIILVTGQGSELNEKILFKYLKEAGLDKIMVETPSYAHYLMQYKFLDEIFINQAGSYIGGPKFLNNNSISAFNAGSEPRAKMVTIHTYNSYFFAFRYRLIY